jgi:N-methylhydantoinase B
VSNRRDIRLQVMWNRLLAVVEEQAQTLVRTAFSTSTREAGDVSAGIFDLNGQMLAQAVTGTPGHINSMALSVGHFLERFPVATMGEGDCYLTNDPWKGTGHLNDFTVVSPAHRKGKLVALFACTSHMVDIGGLGMSPDGRQIYHEGLFVPIMPFATAGVVNEWLLELVRANVREPVQVQGDLYALAACNETGGRRIIEMMDETGIEDLDELGIFIIDSTSRAMRESINRLPRARCAIA